jgi:ribosomal protein S17E
MSELNVDVTMFFQVNAEVRDDPDRPTFARTIRVFDEVDCEIALYEADDIVDKYMEKFRDRFHDPDFFERLVKVYRGKFRGKIKEFITTSREAMKEAGHGPKDTTWGDDGYHKDDDDGNV